VVAVSRPAKGEAKVGAGDVRAVADAALAANKPGTTGYKIGPLDVVEVTVFKVPELSKVMQVSEAGTFNYPLVGEVIAAGKSPRDVEVALTKMLGGKYLKDPQVGVFVKEYNSQRITLEGAIKKPGVYPMQGSMSLLQALALGQGIETTSDDTIVIFRSTDGKRTAARFEVSNIRSGVNADPQLQAGDVVIAGTSAFKEGLNNVLKLMPLASAFALL
jgi:polysaccharide biosynthesis/export protein